MGRLDRNGPNGYFMLAKNIVSMLLKKYFIFKSKSYNLYILSYIAAHGQHSIYLLKEGMFRRLLKLSWLEFMLSPKRNVKEDKRTISGVEFI